MRKNYVHKHIDWLMDMFILLEKHGKASVHAPRCKTPHWCPERCDCRSNRKHPLTIYTSIVWDTAMIMNKLRVSYAYSTRDIKDALRLAQMYEQTIGHLRVLLTKYHRVLNRPIYNYTLFCHLFIQYFLEALLSINNPKKYSRHLSSKRALYLKNDNDDLIKKYVKKRISFTQFHKSMLKALSK